MNLTIDFENFNPGSDHGGDQGGEQGVCTGGETKDIKTLVQTMIDRPKFLSGLSPILSVDEVVQAFKDYKAEHLILGTITLGRKRYIQMKDQVVFRLLVKRLRCRLKKVGNVKYIFVTEFTKAGLIHMHGIMSNEINKAFWDDMVGCYGSRNNHISSFQQVKNKEKAINYIMKDQFDDIDEELEEINNIGMTHYFPIIHNLI